VNEKNPVEIIGGRWMLVGEVKGGNDEKTVTVLFRVLVSLPVELFLAHWSLLSNRS